MDLRGERARTRVFKPSVGYRHVLCDLEATAADGQNLDGCIANLHVHRNYITKWIRAYGSHNIRSICSPTYTLIAIIEYL